MKKVQWIHSMAVILVASLGLASMGCFSFMAANEPPGTKIAAAGADIVTAPVQVVVLVIVLAGELVAEIPMPVSQSVDDASKVSTSPVIQEEGATDDKR